MKSNKGDKQMEDKLMFILFALIALGLQITIFCCKMVTIYCCAYLISTFFGFTLLSWMQVFILTIILEFIRIVYLRTLS